MNCFILKWKSIKHQKILIWRIMLFRDRCIASNVSLKFARFAWLQLSEADRASSASLSSSRQHPAILVRNGGWLRWRDGESDGGVEPGWQQGGAAADAIGLWLWICLCAELIRNCTGTISNRWLWAWRAAKGGPQKMRKIKTFIGPRCLCLQRVLPFVGLVGWMAWHSPFWPTPHLNPID